MNGKINLLLEAERRGILPADKANLLSEARRRGLIPDQPTIPNGINESDFPTGPMTPEMLAKEKQGIEANPWVGNPFEILAAAATGGTSGAVGFLPKLAGGLKGGISALLTEPITGTIAEKAGEIHPALSLPVAIATGLLTGKGIDKVLAPGKSKLVSGAEELFQKAKTEGLPLSPDVFTKSKFTRAVRWVSDQLPPGSWEMSRMRGKINEKLMLARNQFITDTLQMQKPGTAKGLRETGKDIFSQAVKQGKEISFPMPQLKQFLDENIMDPDLKVNKKTYDALMKAKKDIAENGTLDMETVNDLFAKAWGSGKFGKMTGSQQRIHGQLNTALDADMTAIDKTANTKVYDLIKQGKGMYKSAADAEKSDVIERMLSSATKYDADKQAYTFHPLLFKSQIERNSKRLEAMFKKDPNKLAMIHRFANEMEASATDIARLSKTTSGKGIAGEMFKTGMGVGAIFKQPYLAVPAGFSPIIAHSLMNPKGWLKQWLTVGFQGTGKALPVAQAIKAGKFSIWQNEGDNEGE